MHTDKKQLSDLSDEELLDAAKKMKSTAIINALIIGFMIGIILWSIAKNTLGFFTLIPLYIIYRMVNNSDHGHSELKNILKERNLK